MHFVPKRHYTWHIATQCVRLGSLPAAANWRGEQINGYLKAVSMAAHRMVWHRRVLGGVSQGVRRGKDLVRH
eukprot:4664865-Pyramimonas_sp.AAC.1